MFTFELPRFAKLGATFSQRIAAEPLSHAEIISINHLAAKQLGINTAQPYFQQVMACNNTTGYASIYAGHQFGIFVPQLGDGRALLIGEHKTPNGEIMELQLKGSGLTPYSRMGDGRAVLRSSIREYLCSEAMAGLGVKTTRALAISTSRTTVEREQTETAALLLRYAPSFIRFGHFEYFYHAQQFDALKQLTDFTIRHYFPQYIGNHYADWFQQIVIDSAVLVAQWQAIGFCHGVMNTDNMSILGLTIDYGPFSFMEEFNPAFVCNHSDYHGRYSFQQQVPIVYWNLARLAQALSPLIDIADLQQALRHFEPTISHNYRRLMLNKLALSNQDSNKEDNLLSALFTLLIDNKLDYSLFFRQLSEMPINDFLALPDYAPIKHALSNWFIHYQEHLNAQQRDEQSRLTHMQQVNPKYILRNYLAQQAIEQAQIGDYQMLNALLTVLQTPFEEHKSYEYLAAKTPAWAKDIVLSCSS